MHVQGSMRVQSMEFLMILHGLAQWWILEHKALHCL
jgi:hypothetical protein